MRKVINGRTYNTATSKRIGGTDTSALYKNTKGGYFLYMEHLHVIDPISEEEAQTWAKKHLDIDLSTTSVKPSSDLVTRERVNLTLDTEIIANLRLLAEETGGVMGRMVDKAILSMYGEQFKELRKE